MRLRIIIFMALFITCAKLSSAQALRDYYTLEKTSDYRFVDREGSLYVFYNFTDSVVVNANLTLHSNGSRYSTAIVKYNNQGLLDWHQLWSSTGNVSAIEVAINNNNQIFINLIVDGNLTIDNININVGINRHFLLLLLDRDGHLLKNRILNTKNAAFEYHQVVPRGAVFDEKNNIYFSFRIGINVPFIKDTLWIDNTVIAAQRSDVGILLKLDSNLNLVNYNTFGGKYGGAAVAMDVARNGSIALNFVFNADTLFLKDTFVIMHYNLLAPFMLLQLDSNMNYLHHSKVVKLQISGGLYQGPCRAYNNLGMIYGYTAIEKFQIGNVVSMDYDIQGSYIYGYNTGTHKEWLYRISGHCNLNDVICDSQGHIYCTGSIGSTVDFSTDTLVFATSGYNGFILILDTLGRFEHVQFIAQSGYDFPTRLDPMAHGNMAVSGDFYGGQFQWDDSLLSSNIPANHKTFVASFRPWYKDSTLAIHTSDDPVLSLYPNPFSSALNLDFPSADLHQIEIDDLQGKIMYKAISRYQHVQVDCQSWSAGTYLLQIKDKHGKLMSSKTVIKTN